MIYDVLIIGGGITGSLIARELSRYDLKICLLEKENDVANKTTSANSAIIHSGYDPVPGTLKAKLNVLGNKKFDQLCKELCVHFERIGSLTVATNEKQLQELVKLKERGTINGVDVEILSKEEVNKLEPNLSKNVVGALLAETAGIIDPFNLCVHAMENAIDNGVNLFLNSPVIDIKKDNEIYQIITPNNLFETKIVINAAGNYADKIASMVEKIDWSITPRKGEYYLLDHFKKGFVNHVIFPLPSEKGKGVLVAPTTSGNYLVGPSSESQLDKEDFSTDSYTLGQIKSQANDMIDNIPYNQVIRVFAGLRPSSSRHDFIIENSKLNPCFINVAGIESPGLASSPAIADYVINNYVLKLINAKKKINFNPCVKPYHRFNHSLLENEIDFINEHKEYGKMICNCEKVSEGEIMDVLSRSCPPHSVKGVKRRTRAGFGKCQGGFCEPSIVLLLAKHYNISPLEVPLNDDGSYILANKVKDVK